VTSAEGGTRSAGAASLETRARAVFDEAIELNGDDRRAYLERACAGDAELLSRVEVLLRGAETDDGFLSAVSGVSGGSAPAWPGGRAGAIDGDRAPGQGNGAHGGTQVGTSIGPYRIVSQVGEGGFGAVYLAQQDRPVRRRVALKVIKLGMDTKAVVARFEQERQALAVMDHPNIAKVLDAGATATGRPYFVMEYVEGVAITEYCDRHRLTIPQRLELFVQVCGAVQHAHTKGVIHRDLKPSNILVRGEDGAGERGSEGARERGGREPARSGPLSGPLVKVIDFGIAKAMDRSLTEKTVFTEQGQPIGTPEYMSPEQGVGRDLDTRTDVYSLGVVLYELLAGLPPFDPWRMRSAAYPEVQRILLEVEPPKPSTRLQLEGSKNTPTVAGVAAKRAVEPGRLGTLLKGELDWIVMRAIEKDRSRRYESPGALAADVGRYLSGEAVLAAPPSRAYRVKKFVTRHRGPVIAAGLVVAALAAGTVGTALGMIKARVNAADAQAQAGRADREAREARLNAGVAASVNTLLTSMIARADRGKEGGRADLTVREVMDAAAKELETNTGAYEPGVVSATALNIGGTYRELNLFPQAERMMRLHAEQELGLHGERSVEHAEALGELAQVLKVSGKLDEAGGLYDRARAAAAGLGAEGEETLARIDVNRTALLDEKGDVDGAEAAARGAIASFERRGKTNTEPYVKGLNNLAAVLYHKGDLDGAEKYFQQSVEVQKGAGVESGRELVTTLHNLAALRFSKRDYAGAERTARDELAMARQLYGEEHLDTAAALESLGVILGTRDDWAGAEKANRQSLAIRGRLLTPDHPLIAGGLRRLGTVLMREEKFAEAEEVLRRACEITDKSVDRGETDSVITHYQLGVLMQRGGKLAEAEAMLRPTVSAAEGSALLKEGAKYEWARHAVSSLLGALIVDQLADAAAGARVEKLREAGALEEPAAERLIVVGPKMGPKMRAEVVPAALERAARLREVWEGVEPGAGHADKAREWRDKLAAFNAPAGGPSK
jgi:eukaryotic-like serine/threonine-protein kinase